MQSTTARNDVNNCGSNTLSLNKVSCVPATLSSTQSFALLPLQSRFARQLPHYRGAASRLTPPLKWRLYDTNHQSQITKHSQALLGS